MKKTLALITAIVIAALSISTLSICAFAEPTTAEATAEATEAPTVAETTTAIDLGHPTRPGQNETTTAKADDATQATADANKTTVASGDEIKTNPEGVTSIDDPDETTKAPANVDDDIPNTGSKAVIPAIALLALAGSVAVAVKAKKD